VVLKPSEHAPATAAVMKQLIRSVFSDQFVLYVEGDGAEVVPLMMNDFRFDHVFYTGGSSVGKLIYKMAAEKLVPVTLELGGKSPAIVEQDAVIKVAARRIAVTRTNVYRTRLCIGASQQKRSIGKSIDQYHYQFLF
jgi:aldehyde dehydrogenase (NAD+)